VTLSFSRKILLHVVGWLLGWLIWFGLGQVGLVGSVQFSSLEGQ